MTFPFFLAAFGAGHFYARSYSRGLALFVTAWAGVFLSVVLMRPVFVVLAPLVMILDGVGSFRLIREQNRRLSEGQNPQADTTA